MTISQDLENIAENLMKRAANDNLSPTQLFKGLMNIKEKADKVLLFFIILSYNSFCLPAP